MVPFISLKLGYISVRLRPFCSSKNTTISNHIYFFAEFRLAVFLSLSISSFFSFFCSVLPFFIACLSCVNTSIYDTIQRAYSNDVTVAGYRYFFFSGCYRIFNFCESMFCMLLRWRLYLFLSLTLKLTRFHIFNGCFSKR